MTRKDELVNEYNKISTKRSILIAKRDSVISNPIPFKVITLHTLGVIPICIIDAILGVFPLFSLLYSIGGPVIYTINKNKKISKLNKEISRVTNEELFPVSEELDELKEQERMEKLLKSEHKDRFVEELKKPMPGKVKRVLDNRVDRIPGTDKVRTFASSVPGLYSEESDMKNVISNRDAAFLDRNNEYTLKRKI